MLFNRLSRPANHSFPALFALILAFFSAFDALSHDGNKLVNQIEGETPLAHQFLPAQEGLAILRREIQEKEALYQAELEWMILEPWINAWYVHLKVVSERLKNASEPFHFNSAEKTLNAHRILQLTYQFRFLREGSVPPRLRPFSDALDRFLKTGPSLVQAQMKRSELSREERFALLEALNAAKGLGSKENLGPALQVSDFFDELLFTRELPNAIREAFFVKADFSPEALALLKELHQRGLPLFLPDRILAGWNESIVKGSEGPLYCQASIAETMRSESLGEYRARDFVTLFKGWLAIDDRGSLVFEGLPEFWSNHLSPEWNETDLKLVGVKNPDEDLLLFRTSDGRLFDHRYHQIGKEPKQAAAVGSHAYAWISRKGTLKYEVMTDRSESQAYDDTELQAWVETQRNRFVRFQSLASSDDSLIAIDAKGTPHGFGFWGNSRVKIVKLNGFRATTEYADLNLEERVTWVQCRSGIFDFSIMEGPDYSFYVRFDLGGDHYMGVAGFQPRYGLKVYPRNQLHLNRWENGSEGVGYDRQEKQRIRDQLIWLHDFETVIRWCPNTRIPNSFWFEYEKPMGSYLETRFTFARAVIVRPEVEGWEAKFQEAKAQLQKRRQKDPNYGLSRFSDF